MKHTKPRTKPVDQFKRLEAIIDANVRRHQSKLAQEEYRRKQLEAFRRYSAEMFTLLIAILARNGMEGAWDNEPEKGAVKHQFCTPDFAHRIVFVYFCDMMGTKTPAKIQYNERNVVEISAPTTWFYRDLEGGEHSYHMAYDKPASKEDMLVQDIIRVLADYMEQTEQRPSPR